MIASKIICVIEINIVIIIKARSIDKLDDRKISL